MSGRAPFGLLLLVAMAAAMAWPPVAFAAQRDCTLPADYVIGDRPDPAGTPTVVQASVFLVDINAISDTEQRFTADAILQMGWNDWRLVDLAGCSFEITDIWQPQIMLVNRRSVTRIQPDRFTVDAGGAVHYWQRGYGDFSVRLDLREFPFDQQRLELRTLSTRYGPDELLLTAAPGTGRAAEFLVSGWAFGEVIPQTFVAIPDGKELAGIAFTVLTQRESGFFVWKLIVPLTIVVAMAWLAQWIEPGMAPARIGMSATAVLTVFAYQFSVANLLPRLSYTTRMDHFFIGAAIMVFAGLVLTVAVVELNRAQKTDWARRMLRLARFGFPLAFMLVAWIAFG